MCSRRRTRARNSRSQRMGVIAMLKGLRFAQHYLWWQHLNHLTVLAWGFDDTSDDELAIAEHIQAKGVIGGESIGMLSDTEYFAESSLRDQRRKARQWRGKERPRQMARQRQADRLWRAAEQQKFDRELALAYGNDLANDNAPVRCICGARASFPHGDEWFCDGCIDQAYGLR